MPCRVAIFLLLGSVAALATGCSGGENPQETTSEGAPLLRIASLKPVGAPKWRPNDSADCVELGHDADGTIAVELQTEPDGQLKNWTLRGFEGCGRALQCGYVLVTVTGPSADAPLYSVGAAATNIPVPLGKSFMMEGRHTFKVALRDDEGAAFLDAGKPYADEVTVTVRRQCAPVGGPDAGHPSDGAAPADASGGDAQVSDASSDGPPPDASADSAVRDAAVRDGAGPEATTDSGSPIDASSPADAPLSDAPAL